MSTGCRRNKEVLFACVGQSIKFQMRQVPSNEAGLEVREESAPEADRNERTLWDSKASREQML